MDRLIKLVSQIAFINFLVVIGLVTFLAQKAATTPQVIVVTPQPTTITEIIYVTLPPLPSPTPIIIHRKPNTTVPPTTAPTIRITTPAPTKTPSPTQQDPFAQLAQHNTPSDCWIRYENSLYNITAFFGSHPGGNEVLAKYCGKDATQAYNTKEIGVAHSAEAHQLLESFKIQ